MAALASLGLALASGAALAQKAETPKDAKKAEAPAKADAKKADAKKAEAPKAEAKKADAKAAAPMDINTASEKELASLKGIGEVRAKAIVKGRPYKGKNDLVDKKIIPQGVYDDIKDQIIAKQDTAAAPKKDEKKK
jgi:DNA uptake protein ComE-like DNA-binding protein